MKAKTTLLVFSVLLAGSLAVMAQDPAPAVAAVAEASAAVTNALPAPTGAVIPLIVMDEVPLSDAIKNLARQANINYLLDPKIPFGQPDASGKVIQPNVSIRWENVTPEQALFALLNNYNLQLIEDPKTHIGRVTVKDPAAKEPLLSSIVQLKFASPSNILAAAQTVLTDPRSRVVADVRTSQLVVLATEKEVADVQRMIEHLDTATKQVLIEATLMETSMNPSTSKGIDWSGTLAAQHVSFGNGLVDVANSVTTTTLGGTPTSITTPGGRVISGTSGSSSSTTVQSHQGNGGLSLNTVSGLAPNAGFLTADGLHAVMSFLNQNSDAKVLSQPRTVTLDNETATLSVTRASPIINVTAGTANTTGGSQITYTNLGVILNVTPRISANNYVNLRVQPEVSRIFDTVTKNINSAIFQADEYDVRKIETHVMIPSGHTLVLGGLMQDDIRTSNNKVPGLGDVPLPGLRFPQQHQIAPERESVDLHHADHCAGLGLSGHPVGLPQNADGAGDRAGLVRLGFRKTQGMEQDQRRALDVRRQPGWQQRNGLGPLSTGID